MHSSAYSEFWCETTFSDLCDLWPCGYILHHRIKQPNLYCAGDFTIKFNVKYREGTRNGGGGDLRPTFRNTWRNLCGTIKSEKKCPLFRLILPFYHLDMASIRIDASLEYLLLSHLPPPKKNRINQKMMIFAQFSHFNQPQMRTFCPVNFYIKPF